MSEDHGESPIALYLIIGSLLVILLLGVLVLIGLGFLFQRSALEHEMARAEAARADAEAASRLAAAERDRVRTIQADRQRAEEMGRGRPLLESLHSSIGAAGAFVSLVQDNQLREAYQSTSPDYQKRVSWEQFLAVMDSAPSLRQPLVMIRIESDFERHRLTYRPAEEGDQGDATIVTVGAAEGEWKVQGIEPARRPPAPVNP